MALIYSPEITGMNFGGWYSATDPNGIPLGGEEAYQSYIDRLWDLGVRYVRNGGSNFVTANESAKIISAMCKAKGFINIYGGCRVSSGNTTTPITWLDYQNNFLIPNCATPAGAGTICDIFSIGNEEEDRRGTQTLSSAVRSSNIVTATFSSPHGYAIGDTVIIAGATPSDVNNSTGATIINVPDANSFTYSAAGVDGTATGTITAKMTVETHIRLIKATAVAVRAILNNPNIKIIYSTTGNYVSQWVTAGITPGVDMDYWGLQTYSSSATDLTSFRSVIQQAYDGLGSLMWLTEWNLYFNWGTALGQVNLERMNRETRNRLKIIQQVGVSHAFFFGSANLAHDFETIDYRDRTPRNNYYALFGERKTFVIDRTSGSSYTTRTAAPAAALRKPAYEVNRNKCIDFNQSNSYLTFTYPNSFSAANLTKFTIAVRLYCRTTGGSSAGRILSSVNQRFVELFTSATGYNVQVWHATSNGTCVSGTGSIALNTWQTVFVTFDDAENFPRIYLDMVEKTTTTSNKSGARGNTYGQVGSIGNRSDLIRGFDGKMDDFFIWNRVLSSVEMRAYKSGNIPSGYLLGYTMDESSGSVIDVGPDGANGTLTNATQNVTSYST